MAKFVTGGFGQKPAHRVAPQGSSLTHKGATFENLIGVNAGFES